jgi:hypothetical protein
MSAPRDFSTRRRARPRPVDTVLLAAAVAAVAASGHTVWTSVARARDVEASVVRVRGELGELRSRIRSLEAPSGRGAAARLASRALLTTVAPPPRVLADLEALMPGDVRLQSLSLRYEEQVRLDLRVAARRAASYDLFLERLGASPAFADLVPGAESRERELRAAVVVTYRPAGVP